VKIALILAVLLVALLAFAYRPATVIGVHGDALAHSVGGGDLLGQSHCDETTEGVWDCAIWDSGTSGAAEYRVETKSFGCWDAEPRRTGGRGKTPEQLSGCINAIDVLSPF
jgi:hypothetical protein